jgi:hypothetical protein
MGTERIITKYWREKLNVAQPPLANGGLAASVTLVVLLYDGLHPLLPIRLNILSGECYS